MEKKTPAKLSDGQKAEVSSAREVLQAFAKALRALSMYLPNNPLRQQFLDGAFSRLRKHSDEHGDLGLTIDHSRILVHGTAVYDDPDLKDNMAFRLFADGIRFLEIRKEVADEELSAFFTILERERSPEDDDDIVTELWEEDLGGIFFAVAEESADTGRENLGARPESTSTLRQGIEKAHAEESPAVEATVSPLRDIPQSVFVLSAEELTSLDGSIRFELERQPLEDLSDILLSILLAETDTRTFEEFLTSLESLCRDMLVLGRLENALHIAAILPVLQEGPKVPEAHREVVRAVKGRILTDTAIDSLAGAIDREGGVTRAQFSRVISIFGQDAISPLCLLLGKIEKRNMRKSLVDALVENGRNAPEDFFPFLGDSRWYLVRNTVHILRRIGSPRATPRILPLVDHDDHRVRREVLQYFEESKGVAGGTHILRFLKDPDSSIRSSATKAMARRKDPRAMTFLAATVRDPGFPRKDIAEREKILEAIGHIAPGAAVDIAAGMLSKRYLLNKSAELEAVRCAVAGLRSAGTPEAAALLRTYAGRKKGKAGQLIRKALDALSGPGAGAE